jgi:hypothetical protein
MIERYEFKYLIDETMVPSIRAAALTACVPDPHVGRDGTYLCASLYFDTLRAALVSGQWATSP